MPVQWKNGLTLWDVLLDIQFKEIYINIISTSGVKFSKVGLAFGRLNEFLHLLQRNKGGKIRVKTPSGVYTLKTNFIE